MSNHTNVDQPDKQTWALIIKSKNQRRKYLSEEQDLIKARNKLKEDLSEMGSKRTPERLKTCADYVEVIQGIDRCRAEAGFLADVLDKLVEYGEQGRFVDDGTLEQIEKSLRGEDMPLYDNLVKAAGIPAGDEPIGTPENKPRKGRGKGEPTVTPADEPALDMNALAKDPERWSKPVSMFIEDEPLEQLHKAGLVTLGNAYWFMRKDGNFTKLGLTLEAADALGKGLLKLADGGLKPPPEGMRVEQPKPGKRGGKVDPKSNGHVPGVLKPGKPKPQTA